ncbi:MAG: ATP-binding cassette domain-containing protein [Geminicoccaceae bacterium]|nr:MAG: ATP-binding cassette domain-containing protein [Geminicoccaceae bacterium]
MIVVEGLWKSYGDRSVLERLNLTIREGEFVTLVGASGCGKTTFLRILLGDERPTKGRLTLDGRPLRPEPGPDRGVVFQRYSVFPHLTVLQNAMLGLEFQSGGPLGRLRGRAWQEARARASALLAEVGLAHVADAWPSALSGGMQQRLALAQALVLEPRLLLLDEPFGALDPGIRIDMHQLISKLWHATGMTVVMVTHDLGEAFKLGTRVLTFDKVRHDRQAPERYGATITYDLRGRARPLLPA